MGQELESFIEDFTEGPDFGGRIKITFFKRRTV